MVRGTVPLLVSPASRGPCTLGNDMTPAVVLGESTACGSVPGAWDIHRLTTHPTYMYGYLLHTEVRGQQPEKTHSQPENHWMGYGCGEQTLGQATPHRPRKATYDGGGGCIDAPIDGCS